MSTFPFTKKPEESSRYLLRSDLKLDDAEGTYCLPTAIIFVELERMGAKTTSWNEFSSTMASAIIYSATLLIHFPCQLYSKSSSKPQKKKSRSKQRQDNTPTEPTTKETTLEEHVSIPTYDPPPSGEDIMQLAELMSLCTNLQEMVLDLEKAKTAQAKEITSLKKRVKQLEKKRKLRTSGLRRLRKGRKIKDLDADAEVTLVNETQEMNDENLMFDTVSAAEVVTIASASVVILDELTIAQTLIEIKTTKPKPVTTAATTVTSGIDKEDLETIWKLFKSKHRNTRSEEDYVRMLWGDLKVMFEPDIKVKKGFYEKSTKGTK
ncbi:hypothetical protein Tco_1154051 [Tanacetum coccineum]